MALRYNLVKKSFQDYDSLDGQFNKKKYTFSRHHKKEYMIIYITPGTDANQNRSIYSTVLINDIQLNI